VLLAAAISVDLGVRELVVANALLPTPVHELDGHHVPRSELVLLCELTGELADEGPFLDLTETFDIVRRQPVARVERVLARPQPLFHALLPSGEEHKVLMGMPREPSILRAVNEVCQCHDVRVTPGGCCWLHGVVQIRKRADADARAAIDAAFRGHPSMKHVFVVDEDVDIDDPAAIEWALATRFQGDRDLVLRPAQRGSSLDPSAAPETHLTAKLGFDLTIPLATPAEPYRRARPPLTVRLEDYLARGERDADEG